jgi:dihydroorotase-like cyclic amidohydrolase
MSSKALVSHRQVTPEVADDEIVDVGAGITSSGDTLTIGEVGKTLALVGTVSLPTATSNTTQKTSVAFTQVELAALAGGVTHLEKTIVLPANAHFVAATATGVTAFKVDESGDTYGITIGTSTGGNQVATSLDVSFGQTGFPKPFAAGAQGYYLASHNAATFYVRLSSAEDLNDTVAGGATVNVFYVIVPPTV